MRSNVDSVESPRSGGLCTRFVRMSGLYGMFKLYKSIQASPPGHAATGGSTRTNYVEVRGQRDTDGRRRRRGERMAGVADASPVGVKAHLSNPPYVPFVVLERFT